MRFESQLSFLSPHPNLVWLNFGLCSIWHFPVSYIAELPQPPKIYNAHMDLATLPSKRGHSPLIIGMGCHRLATPSLGADALLSPCVLHTQGTLTASLIPLPAAHLHPFPFSALSQSPDPSSHDQQPNSYTQRIVLHKSHRYSPTWYQGLLNINILLDLENALGWKPSNKGMACGAI